MKLLHLAVAIALTACLCCTAQAYTITLDETPPGGDLNLYYWTTYGIALEFPNLEVVDHIGSQWGPPHSGNNVLVVAASCQNSRITTLFKGQPIWSVYSFGAFFSTEQDAVLQMVGYDGGLDRPVASAYIGAAGVSWNNEYVEISSPAGNISMVELYPVSTDAFHHFCLDDLTVTPVPEPSSLAALALGLGGIVCGRIRRKRS